MRKRLDHDPPSLTEKREEAKLTKAALARELQCSRSLVTEWEDGTRNANEDWIPEIAKVLGCTEDDLRARDESEGEAAPSATGELPELRDAERSAGADDMPELRGEPVERTAS